MKFKAMTAVAALLVAAPTRGGAEEEAELVVNGEIEMVTQTEPTAHLGGALPAIMSGWRFRSDETQQLQMDDFDNSGMIFVDQAQAAWDMVEGSEGKSCASCHNDVETSMKGVRAVYPKWNEDAGEVRTPAQQINDWRETQMLPLIQI